MHGECDAMDPLENSRMLAERIPNGELAVIPGAGHAYALERPDESLAVLLDWHESHSPIAAGAPRSGLAASVEPLLRPLGLHVGALRTGKSLVRRVAGRADAREGWRAQRASKSIASVSPSAL